MVLDNWDKQEKQIGAIFVIVVALALYLNYTGVIGRSAMLCDNFEPSSFDEFVSEIDSLDGSVDRDGNFDLVMDSGLQSYPLYRSSSSLGLINVIDYSGQCNDFLELVNNNPYSRSAESGSSIPVCTADCVEGWVVIDNDCVYNDCYSGCGDFVIYTDESSCLEDPEVIAAEFTVINQKQVLAFQDGFMWCNKDNNLVMYAPTIVAMENYFDEFVVCTENVYDPVNNETVNDGSSDEEVVDPVFVDPVVNETVSDVSDPTSEDRDDPADTDSDVMWIIVASFVGVFALYWFFERGPDKGFFQDGKKRRGKKK